MINALKALLQASGQFATVQLAQGQEPLDNLQLDTPAVVLFYDKNRYQPSDTDRQVHQLVHKQIFCQLVCHADTVDAKEQALVQTLIGFEHSSQHYPMEAVESDTHKIKGDYYSRWVVFRTSTHIRQS